MSGRSAPVSRNRLSQVFSRRTELDAIETRSGGFEFNRVAEPEAVASATIAE